MGTATFDMLLQLASVGYTVSFSKAYEYSPAQVLRIELSKGNNQHVEFIDISVKRVGWMHLTTDDVISRTLEKARWEFEYDFGKEETE